MKRYLVKGGKYLFQSKDFGATVSDDLKLLQGYSNHKEFFENGNPNLFANLLYSEEEESTQTYLKSCRAEFENLDIYDNCLSNYNCIYITNNQTKGKGRLHNKWIGNSSTLCFTYTYHIPSTSSIDFPDLFKSIVFMPYLNCICVVKTLQNLGLSDSKAKIKWPNDIYGENNPGHLCKMAGILCESEKFTYKQINKSGLVAHCGIGINFTSSPPGFTSVQELIPEMKFSKGEFLKNFFSVFEASCDLLCTEEGRSRISLDLTKHWMHTNQAVDVNSDSVGKVKGKIIGISKSGFLEVQSNEHTYEVYPEGHSLDVANSRIIQKT